MSLKTFIYKRIKNSGPLSFADYMHLALYSPDLGYYTSGLPKFGPEGDFVTAAEITPLFGYALANQCQQILQTLPLPTLFEFGAGSGLLCVHLLQQLEANHCLPHQYFILEVSAELQARQKTFIHSMLPHLFEKVVWLDDWPTFSFNGVIIANEVLDAMPVHRFRVMEDGIYECFVDLNTENNLIETYKLCTDQRLVQYIQHAVPKFDSPYQSEANLFVESWVEQCHAMLSKGAMFLMDYGFPRHEFYHSDRSQGTLMCHYRHRAHTNPLAHPGEEDITAHVDFTQVAEAAVRAGFHVAGYCNQASFLLSNGLLDFLLQLPEFERMREQQNVKRLVHEHEMGELFKVIALCKNLDLDLCGFQLQDKRASL
jgi:SAM-dependent MidA family methyltransferase